LKNKTRDIEREKTKSFVEARSKNPKENKGCVTLWPCHFTLKRSKYLKAKEELWKLKYFTMQKYNLPKNILY
jgi:hypothetical protein